MNKVKTRYIPLNKMERMTEAILTDFGYSFTSTKLRPVPIDEIIEFHFGLDLLWDRIDHFDAGGLVMAAIIPAKRTIILNESCRLLFEEKIGTMHFTLAHELGHWVLHTDHAAGNDESAPTPYYCRSTTDKPIEEIQADLFAGCLLMPRPVMTAVVKSMRMRGRLQLSGLYELANACQVTISALKVRLEQIGLLYVHHDGTVSSTREGVHQQLCFDL